jgi:hypothetical protein
MSSLEQLFEEFNRRVGTPLDYNHLLAGLLDVMIQGGVNVVWDNGTPYIKDPARDKMLSLSRPVISSAYYGQNQSSRYLKIGGVTSSGNGFLAPRKGTITALWAKSRDASSWTIEIRKNDSPVVLASTPIVSGWGKVDLLSVNFDEGDYLQLYLNGVAVDHPIACFEFAWRI